MTEIKLPYDRSVVPQVTGWSCGPAAVEIILNSLGINVSEHELIRQAGTTQNGTDHISQLTRVLNQHVPHANYVVVELPRDPPTDAQCETLWEHLTRSLHAGFGLPVNWVVPPNNRPRGVRGSVSPNYGNQWYWHYTAALGYASDEHARDVPGGRAVWIADSGFNPGGYWISFWNFCTLIPPKGYGWAANSPERIAPPPPAPAVVDRVELLAELMGNAVSMNRYEQLMPAVTDALVRCDCLTVDRVAMWLAQIGHESGGLRWMEEIADGSAYEGRTDLGNTQVGDGTRFKGRGPIQVTGRHNYGVLSAWAYEQGLVDDPQAFINHPTLLAGDDYGFLGVIWYWTVARASINSMADRRDIEGVTRAINGGLNGLADRRSRYERALARGDVLLTLLSTDMQQPVEVVEPPAPPPASSFEVAWCDRCGVPRDSALCTCITSSVSDAAAPPPWGELIALQRETVALLKQLAAVNVQMAELLAESRQQ